MDQSLVHTFSWGNSYGPNVLKVLLKFPLHWLLVHGWLFPVPPRGPRRKGAGALAPPMLILAPPYGHGQDRLPSITWTWRLALGGSGVVQLPRQAPIVTGKSLDSLEE